MKDRFLWSDGKIINASDFYVHGLSPTAQFGINVFEGIRAYRHTKKGVTTLFRFEEHFDRLAASCEGIGIALPFNYQQLLDGVMLVTSANNYKGDVAYRIIVYIDSEGTWSSRGDISSVVIAPIERARTNPNFIESVKTGISNVSRISKFSMDPGIKAGANYLNGRYALREVQLRGYDDAILLDSDGFVSEGCGANVMMVKNNIVVSPRLENSILNGITKRTIPFLAETMDLDFEERNISPQELLTASDVFFCGTAAEIKPIRSIDGEIIGSGKSEFSRELLSRYIKLVTGDLMGEKSWFIPLNLTSQVNEN
ncbi:aminotransferase class IV [Gammaproteobacteria bacterium]|nr:aminotransferase class IV [Gammaproteobacteria bacterium]